MLLTLGVPDASSNFILSKSDSFSATSLVSYLGDLSDV